MYHFLYYKGNLSGQNMLQVIVKTVDFVTNR